MWMLHVKEHNSSARVLTLQLQRHDWLLKALWHVVRHCKMISCKGSKQTQRIHANSRCGTLQFQYCLSQKHSRRLSPGNFYGELETIWPPASRSDLSNSQPRLEDQNEAEPIFLRLSFRSHIPVFCQIWIFIQAYLGHFANLLDFSAHSCRFICWLSAEVALLTGYQLCHQRDQRVHIIWPGKPAVQGIFHTHGHTMQKSCIWVFPSMLGTTLRLQHQQKPDKVETYEEISAMAGV